MDSLFVKLFFSKVSNTSSGQELVGWLDGLGQQPFSVFRPTSSGNFFTACMYPHQGDTR
jgi:hypothetical protein